MTPKKFIIAWDGVVGTDFTSAQPPKRINE